MVGEGITLSTKSSNPFSRTSDKLKKYSQGGGDYITSVLNRYGQAGVAALMGSTPTDTGLTGVSWSYEVKVTKSTYTIVWKNSHIVAGTPLVILLQYGHGTGTGGWVAGRDFINPVIKPLFDQILEEVRKAVKSA